jgi:hypothetical protein
VTQELARLPVVPLGRWRAASLVVGIPTCLAFAYVAVVLVIGFPISLLALPFIAPVLLIGYLQLRAAWGTWQGKAASARALRRWCLIVGGVIAVGLFLSHLQGDDGVIRSEEIRHERAVERFVVTALMCINGVGLLLLLHRIERRPVAARTVAVAALVVLLLGLVVAATLPSPSK